jgi:restriction system protein
MAVPEFHIFLRPVLEAFHDGAPRHWRDVERAVSAALKLTEDEQQELLASGRGTRVEDRVQWALTYLRQAKLIERTGKGTNRITERGKQYLPTAPKVITRSELYQFPEYAEFQRQSRPSPTNGKSAPPPSQPALSYPESLTPEERMEASYQELNAALAQEVLERVKGMPPAFFERLIVKLMLRLGYGRATEEFGEVLGKSGDGGVDGVINQDKLGLEKIYLQAKRWSDGPVGRKEVQAFVGALSGQGASKGVFMTTSCFTKEATSYASNLSNFKISLVDGLELARLMIEHDLGVALVQRYEVKRIDSDFFVSE